MKAVWYSIGFVFMVFLIAGADTPQTAQASGPAPCAYCGYFTYDEDLSDCYNKESEWQLTCRNSGACNEATDCTSAYPGCPDYKVEALGCIDQATVSCKCECSTY
jgi:hypothetical protein